MPFLHIDWNAVAHAFCHSTIVCPVIKIWWAKGRRLWNFSHLTFLPQKDWHSVGLSFTPKVHGILDHSIMQMHKIGGFSDMLEDDIELMHHISGRFEWQVSWMKSDARKAESHAKMESKLHNRDVEQKQRQINENAKQNFKQRNHALIGEEQAKWKKMIWSTVK